MTRIEVTIRIEVIDINRAKAIRDSIAAQADALPEVVQMETQISDYQKYNDE